MKLATLVDSKRCFNGLTIPVRLFGTAEIRTFFQILGFATMDTDITQWILEFFLRKPIPELLIKKLLTNPQIPISENNTRLKKTLLLRSIEEEISNSLVSEGILEFLEIIEELDRNEGVKVVESIKEAYRAVAVECTVKFLGGSLAVRGGQEKYFEAVKRIWRGRVEKLEVEKRSELITEELRRYAEEIEAAVWDTNAAKRLLGRNTRGEAYELVGVYLREAKALMGPPFLERVVRMARELQQKEAGGGNKGGKADYICNLIWESGLGDGEVKRNEANDGKKVEIAGNECNLGLELGVGNREINRKMNICDHDGAGTSSTVDVNEELDVGDMCARKEIQKKNVPCKEKHVACRRRHRGPVKIACVEEPELVESSSKHNLLPTPEVNKVQEALKSSCMELRAMVRDPLPDALHVGEKLVAEMAEKVMNEETLLEKQNGKGVDSFNPSVNAAVHKPSAENRTEKTSNEPNSLDNQMLGLVQAEVGNSREPVEADDRNVNAEEPAQVEGGNAGESLQPEEENAREAVQAGDRNANAQERVQIEEGNAQELVQAVGRNAGNPPCSSKNVALKPSLMERNSTARTYEWDDIDDSPEETTKCLNRFRMDSPKRKPVSPLRKYEKETKFAKRRKIKRWSLEEEETLRAGVEKFGKGNWKLILNSNREIFLERTEVDLKDKWRNMTRY